MNCTRTELPLHRLLQRSMAGAGGDHLLEDALRVEIERLASQDHLLEPDRSELRQFAGTILEAFHQGLFHAVERLAALDFAGALDQIRRTDAALRHLRRFQASIRDLREAERAWERLLDELELEAFLELPTLRIPQRLLDLSRSFLRDGRPRESAVVTRLCHQILNRLATPVDAESLSARFQALRRGLAEAELPAAEPMAELDRLTESGQGGLASRLADDLEIELLGWQAHARRSRKPSSALVRELDEVARLAESLRETFRTWLSDQSAAQPKEH